MGHTPQPLKLTQKGTTENALKRAIWIGEKSQLDGSTVSWIDFELPVHFDGSSRDNCVDLLGIDENGKYVLCELKFSCNRNDSPHFACDELTEYDEQLKTYAPDFKLHADNPRSHLFSAASFLEGQYRKVVAADKEYWYYWLRREPNLPTTGFPEIEFYSIEVDPDEFKNQKEKAGGGEFTPAPPSSGLTWVRLSSEKST